jgi:DNA-binding MarR family transcriptional regulator
MNEMNTSPREDYPSRYSAVDAESLEINRVLRATSASLSEAFKRCLTAADFWGTVSRYQILRNLEFADGQLPQSELSRQMDVTSGNLSRLLDGLETEGLVVRVPNQQDRRFSYIRLTPAGHALCERLLPTVGQMASQMLDGFSADEKHVFLALLIRFKKNVDAVYTGAPAPSQA